MLRALKIFGDLTELRGYGLCAFRVSNEQAVKGGQGKPISDGSNVTAGAGACDCIVRAPPGKVDFAKWPEGDGGIGRCRYADILPVAEGEICVSRRVEYRNRLLEMSARPQRIPPRTNASPP